MPTLLVYFTFVLCWKVSSAQCRYTEMGGFVYPIDICAVSSTSVDSSASGKFICTDGRPTLVFYNTTSCEGDPMEYPMPSSLLNDSRDYNYNCYGSSNECQLVDIIDRGANCNSFPSTTQIEQHTQTLVANICPNTGFKVTCDGNMNYNRFVQCGSTAYPSIFNDSCVEISSCYAGTKSSPNEPSPNDEPSVGLGSGTATASDAALATGSTIMIAIIAAVIGALIFILVLCFVCYRQNKKQKASPKQLGSVRMQVIQDQKQQLAQVQQSNIMRVNSGGTTSGGDELPSYDAVTNVPSAPAVPSAPIEEDTEPLPYGWSKAMAADGRVYYQNDITKKTQWKKPITDTTVSATTATTGNNDALPYGWRKAKAPDGRVFYINDVKKITQWKVPRQDVVELVASDDQPGAMGNNVNNNNGDGFETSAAPAAFSTDGGPELNRMETTGEEGGGGPSAPLMDDMDDNDNDKYSEIKDFFYNKVGIVDYNDTYIGLMIDNGFDSLAIIKTLTMQDLVDIGIDKLGHRKKILSEIEWL